MRHSKRSKSVSKFIRNSKKGYVTVDGMPNLYSKSFLGTGANEFYKKFLEFLPASEKKEYTVSGE